MQHYLTYLDSSIKKHWNNPAFSNFGGETYTYGAVAEKIEKYHILFETCGLKKGDKVALYARNSAEWGIAYLAVVAYDAVVVPFLPDFLASAVVELSRFSECRMMICDNVAYDAIKNGDKLLEGLANIKDYICNVNVKDISVFDITDKNLDAKLSDLDKEFSARYPNGVTPDSVNYCKTDMEAIAVISFTSGTTSATSKGVVLPARSLSANLEFARREIPLCEGNTIFSVLPMAHMFGQTFDFLFPLSGGCHITILNGKPVPARLLAGLAAVKPFMFLTVPLVVEKIFKSKVFPTLRKPLMRVLMKVPGINNLILNAIRKKLVAAFGGGLTTGVIIGGAALNREVEDLMQKMKFPYCVGYGMTECGPLISYSDRAKFVKYSCGRRAEPLEVRIDSKDPHRVLGEIQCKGDAVMVGYYMNEEATKNSFTKDGWLKTGDMGIIDRKGNIFIKGRCKNMILSASGQNIYPEEIEDQINNLPYIVESLVVGRKNALVALIVADYESSKGAGLTREDTDALINQSVKELNKQLPAYSQISVCEMRVEPFEKTPKQSIRRFMYT
ncbi:MAG: AMP-binding protein [Bacteroidaceae bacterium]|nr:AMP-binding protein [Bacteroidaceae bacterium]